MAEYFRDTGKHALIIYDDLSKQVGGCIERFKGAKGKGKRGRGILCVCVGGGGWCQCEAGPTFPRELQAFIIFEIVTAVGCGAEDGTLVP